MKFSKDVLTKGKLKLAKIEKKKRFDSSFEKWYRKRLRRHLYNWQSVEKSKNLRDCIEVGKKEENHWKQEGG